MTNTVTKPEYEVGDELYFNNYKREGQFDKVFRPNTGVTVTDVATDESGETVYEVESKKGQTDYVYADEVRLSARVRTSADAARAALEKAEALNSADVPPIDLVDSAEEDKMLQLLSGNNGEHRQLIITDEIQEEYQRHDNDSHKVALYYLELGNKSYFRAGGAFAKIYLEKEYTKQCDKEGNPYVGKGAFDKYIENEFPGISSRVARFYIEIYISFTNWNMTANDMGRVGWTVAKEIAHIAKNETEARNFIHLASTTKGGWEQVKRDLGISLKSQEKITEEEIDLSGGDGERLKKLTHMNFSVFEDQAEQIKSAFDTIYQLYPNLDPEHKSQAFAVMATEWLNNVQQDQGTVTLDHQIAHMETLFPDKEVFVKDRKTGEVYNLRQGYGKVALQVVPESEQPQELQNTVD